MYRKYVSDYFYKAQEIVKKKNTDNTVVVQFFQRKDDAVLAGMEEVLEFLRENLMNHNTKVRYLPDGSKIRSTEVVLELEGRYQDFGIYEGIIDGILSRATSIATNAHHCVRSAHGREVVCMADRSDHYCNQERDGRAMYVGGIRAFSSQAQTPSDDCKIYYSIPHALIQNFKGNLVEAMRAYKDVYPNEDLIALVDFNNDVIKDSLAVLEDLGHELKGVRVDTSSNMSDYMFRGRDNEMGVTPNQIKRLRKALDENGGRHVKIYVSSGFTPGKISRFEDENTPVDAYGVGEYLLRINNTFCADAVKINEEFIAKEGRRYMTNPKLQVMTWGK